MKWGAAAGFVVGAALSAWLLSKYGAAAIFGLVGRAGWGLVPAVLFHLVQLLASAWAWRALMGPSRPRLSVGVYVALRWVREGVNNLLPVAQIGGQVVSVRLLHRRGIALTEAVAGTIGDLTLEVVTQVGFTLLGLGLLLALVGAGGVARTVALGLVAAIAMVGGLVAVQTLGFARLFERAMARLAAATGWRGLGAIDGLDQALRAIWRSPRRLGGGAAWHAISWLLGGAEICLMLHVLGRDVGLGAGLVVESLGQALKSAGFVVPGALGVQEGGLIVVCRLFGVEPELAIALSLVKRLREVALGLPSLVAWQAMEARAKRASA